MRFYGIFPVLIFLSLFCGCQQPETSEVRVLVAASARLPAEECVSLYLETIEQSNQPDILVVSGPSNGLSQQILSGARADLFISANPTWTDVVSNLSDSTLPLVSNRLVIASPNGIEVDSLVDLANPNIGRIAIAAESVPVGNYARQVVGQLPAQTRQAIEGKLVFAKDSSALVAWLESGEVDAAFVYASDVSGSDEIRTVVDIDEGLHDPIVYSIAKLKSANGDANELYQWFRSEEAIAIFAKAGFVPVHKN